MTSRLHTCSCCALSFDSTDTYRQHAKSQEHIEKLRLKAAASGAEIRLDPGESSYQRDDSDTSGVNSDSSDVESDGDLESHAPSFVSEQCIFCEQSSGTFEENMIHMASSHSFIVPFQDSLVVDLETIVWYLHLVIFAYHECISCGKRRNGVQAVQQHMRGAGHCRFDMTDEVAEFYDLSNLDSRIVQDLVEPEDSKMHLPSGKVVSQRSQTVAPNKPRTQRKPLLAQGQEDTDPIPSVAATTAVVGSISGKEVMDKQDRQLSILTAHLSQLSKRDQMALAHLSTNEQRSILASRKKQVDMIRRQENNSRARLNRMGNKTLQTHFRMDGIGRPLG